MRNQKMLAASLVTLATAIVCFMGIRAELTSAKYSHTKSVARLGADLRPANDQF